MKRDLAEKIRQLKKDKNAIVLAHYYQEAAIQDIADCVGDSLALAQQASKADCDIIVFAGVHFMAETAKILNPEKKVLLPDLNASCSLAESCPPGDFESFISQYPDHYVVSYINCSAHVKALSDVIVTSSNALKIIQSIPTDKPILFAPDKNLGRYLMEKTGRQMILWDGVCTVHEAFSLEKLTELVLKHPEAKVIAHPESSKEVLRLADFIGSTQAMLDYVKNSSHLEFIVGTEAGILHMMQKSAPGKTLIPIPTAEENSCACSECAYMKLNTLQKLYTCLLHEAPEITLDSDLMDRARKPLQKMLELSSAVHA